MTTRTLLAVLAVPAVAAELPVREVTLYKHGVAYFQRSGDLKAGETVKLDFKAADMNDVLKSLTLTDRSGAKISGVRYDASEPVQKRLEDFPFDLKSGASLAAFLDQIKGARLELRIGSEAVAGSIVGSRVVRGGERDNRETAEHEVVVLLTDAGEIRTFDLSAATSVKLSDPKLQNQLKDYLAVLSSSRSRDRRSVYIDTTGTAAREMVASYMTPASVWKSAYRLIFGTESQPMLEGWAIVDNTSGEDWTNVKLAVVSGRPISFITELYQPRYVQRPTAELAENRPVGPVVYEGALEKSADTVARLAMPAPPPSPVQAARLGGRQEAASAGGFGGGAYRVQESTIAAATDSRDLGELFEYSFSTPVTVKQGESAMLPFLQQRLNARKLLIYSESYGLHPMNAAELTNSSGKTLDGGPITVYDANAYAGEALVETLKAGDKRLISYGIDLGTRVSTAWDSSAANVREIHYARGLLTTRNAIQETKTFTIHNVDAAAKTIIVEHPVRQGYKLIELKPSETTSNAYRFEVKVAAGGTATLAVREERVYDQTISVSTMTPDIIATWVQNKSLSDAGRRQLEQIAAKKREVASIDAQTKQVDADITTGGQDQERLRRNIDSLRNVAGQQDLVQQYARQLATSEAKLAALRDQQGQLHKQKASAEGELNSLLEKTEF